MHRDQFFVAGDQTKEGIQHDQRQAVHPLVMEHYAAQSRGDSLLKFLQKIFQGLFGGTLFSGMQVDIHLVIRKRWQCLRPGISAA